MHPSDGDAMADHPNKHVISFLRYYCAQDRPEYAVLVDGCWGSGKTWVVRQFFKDTDPNREKHIYVSLYGVRSASDVEREFFVQLHPRLSSAGTTVASKIIGNVAKFGSNLILKTSPDIDGAGATIQSWLTNTEGRVLVFDDLERCAMPLRDMLGYINYFVEHGGYRCIILANEKEIPQHLEGGREYSVVKEKLIGQTLAVKADIDAALNAFLKAITDEDVRRILEQHTDVVRDVFFRSDDSNLRVLRHAIFDAARVLGVLDPEKRSNEEVVHTLLAQHLAYSVEVRSGRLPPESISKIKTEHLAHLIKGMRDDDSDATDGRKVLLTQKYPAADLERPLVDEAFYLTLYRSGFVDAGLLNQSIADSRFFFDTNTPSWQILLDLWSLTEAEFRQHLDDVQRNLAAKNYREIGEVKHVFGMLMFLASSGLIQIPVADLLANAREYVDFLFGEGLLADNADEWGRITDDDNYAHSQFWGIGIPEFSTLRQYIVDTTSKAIAAQMPQAAATLLEEMKADPLIFERRLYHSNSRDNIYYRRPILNYVSVDAFVGLLFELPPTIWRHVARTLRERYTYPEFARALLDELPWLRDLSLLLARASANRRGTLDEIRVNKLIETIDQAIQLLEKLAKRPAPSAEGLSGS